jgi:hypothetical protein
MAATMGGFNFFKQKITVSKEIWIQQEKPVLPRLILLAESLPLVAVMEALSFGGCKCQRNARQSIYNFQ